MMRNSGPGRPGVDTGPLIASSSADYTRPSARNGSGVARWRRKWAHVLPGGSVRLDCRAPARGPARDASRAVTAGPSTPSGSHWGCHRQYPRGVLRVCVAGPRNAVL